MDIFEVKCPGCDSILVIDPKKKKVIETKKPITDDSSGDRFEDARKKVLSSTEAAEAKFKEAQQKEKDKYAKMDALFNEKKDELKDKPIERPDRPFDFD